VTQTSGVSAQSIVVTLNGFKMSVVPAWRYEPIFNTTVDYIFAWGDINNVTSTNPCRVVICDMTKERIPKFGY
jgi:hypothetical protein